MGGRLSRVGVAAGCALTLAACGSAATATPGSSGASPITAAAHQLATEDGSASEQATIAGDMRRLSAYCLETPDELVTEIYDGEQDLLRHNIKADGATVASGLLATARAQPKGSTPTDCGQLVASYLNERGG